jgi:adenine/guanine phosphoribosyltransferase-like PRPP-binding protein
LADVEPVRAYSYVVHLGQAVGEPVTEARIDMHRALAATVVDARLDVDAPAREAQYLSFETLSTAPARIGALLASAAQHPSDAVVIIDLAAAPFELLGERFLYALASAIAAIADGSTRTVLLLLDRIPATETSLLWHGLAALNTDGEVIVAGGDRSIRVFGRDPGRPVGELKKQIRRQGDKLTGRLDRRFARKVLPRLGHYQTTDREGTPLCARFHYDCSLGEPELTKLLDRWVRRRVRTKADRAQITFLLCGVVSDWLENAVFIVADDYGANVHPLPSRPTAQDLQGVDDARTTILVFDVVSSGATLDAAVAAVAAAGVAAEPRAFAALATGKHVLTSGPVTVDPVDIVHRDVRPPADCPQCRAEIPYTDPNEPDRFLRITSFDMWTMLSDVGWGRELYGPEGLVKYEYLPNFQDLFRDYGNWIAFRYSLLLEQLQQTSEVVVVCPAEPAVEELVAKLRLRFEDRLVAVAVSRELINQIADQRVAVAAVEREATKNATEDWQLQLLELRRNQTQVVVIDEFAASGSTAQAMVSLLRAFKVQVAAYLPFLDFNTGLELGSGIAVAPLYELPSPRPT